MTGVKIKKVKPKDIDELQKISKKTFFETYADGNTEEDMQQYLDDEFGVEKLKEELMNRNSQFYFAWISEHIIGYLKINFGPAQTDVKDESSLEIQRIYVLKEFQGRKIGKSLYQKAVEIVKQENLKYLWLGVWEENPKAIEFYERIGFKAFDRHTFKLGDDIQTDIMMKQYLKHKSRKG